MSFHQTNYQNSTWCAQKRVKDKSLQVIEDTELTTNSETLIPFHSKKERPTKIITHPITEKFRTEYILLMISCLIIFQLFFLFNLQKYVIVLLPFSICIYLLQSDDQVIFSNQDNNLSLNSISEIPNSVSRNYIELSQSYFEI